MYTASYRLLALSAVLAVPLAGCAEKPVSAKPTEIEVLTSTVVPEAITLTDELPGRVVAWKVAEIRPQVGGIVRRQLFEQGALVRAGQPLFQIDPAAFQADADIASASLAKASASYRRARGQAERLRPLVEADAISRQNFDDAVAARDQAAAEVAEARASLRRRRLDVGFSRVAAPIAGRIGAANVTEGALVTAGDASPMATVQQIDRVYIDIRQPAERFAALRSSTDAAGPVDIVTGDGQVHPVKGRILFSGIAVDPGTGDALVRVAVDNKGERLLPGMFVRARLPRTTMPRALSVPQQAVARDAGGAAAVSIVDRRDRVRLRPVTLGGLVGGRYVVVAGLQPGERVIVEGQDRVRPGTPVKALPWRKR